METINTENSIYYIPSNMYGECHICKCTKKTIIELFPTRKDGAYYLDKFINHLKTHNLDLKQYTEDYLHIKWPSCPEKNIKTGYKIDGTGVKISRFSRGVGGKKYSEKFRLFCERISKERKGENNPMYQHTPWNKGLTKDDNQKIRDMASSRVGYKMSEESKIKMRAARESSPKKARHTQKHSEETIAKLREITAKRYQDGKFKRETKIHIKVRDFINTLAIKHLFAEEYFLKYYSLDFALPESKIAIEVQGTFFHVDPRIYPNGPQNKVQKRNSARDARKKNFLAGEGWTLIELWETEINDGSFKENLICELKKLQILS